MQELSVSVQEKDKLYIEKTELDEKLRKEQLARTSASKEKQAQLRIVAIEVQLCRPVSWIGFLHLHEFNQYSRF